ncbi:site-specific integrase [Planosporangium flavigriseum]|uniref:Site-specific integrase n=1 Tax=Planosporangium flavigriseum TaxID=373681 RepID=A0A8J3LRA4_9ACTN|nr:site-specific integrase [Planosporangium flavigriseum]GIG76154.1 site-specific integrase [Planosporangium flavigriseum]
MSSRVRARACCRAYPSPNTIKGLRATFRAAMTQAMTEDLVAKNVVSLTRVKSSRKKKGDAWESEEARQFLEAMRAEGDVLYAAWVLVLVLGLRKGELLGLSWDGIDLEAGELRISWQLQRVSGDLLRRETKTEESDAPLPLPPICVAALRHRRAVQAAEMRAAETWQNHANLVFTTRYGTPIEPRNFNRAWDARVNRAQVRRITVHDARRTCGSLLVDLDVHPRVAMQILRHADFSITMEIYSRVSDKKTHEAPRRMGELLEGQAEDEDAGE